MIVADAGYNDSAVRVACLEGTRKKIIKKLGKWKNRWNGTPICWLSGPAGFGKSAISQTIAKLWAQEGTLAASYFFVRNAGDRSHFTHFITTLAYQITVSLPQVKPLVENALRDNPAILQQSMASQLQKLILEPLMAKPLARFLPQKYMIVIDALDECHDSQAVQDFIRVLASACSDRRHPVRWFVTSRREEHIRKAFSDGAAIRTTTSYALEEFDARVDIQMFLEAGFARARRENSRLMHDTPSPWPSSDDMRLLVRKTSGLFVYASTVMKFVIEGQGSISPEQRLQAVLGLHTGLDPLYNQVLKAVPQISWFPRVLTTLMLARRQPSVNILADMLELSTQDVLHALLAIQSIIHIPADNVTPIELNHTSLRDFLLDRDRSNDLFIDPSEAHFVLALDCVKLMNKTIKQDIFPTDGASEYAAIYWHDHLCQSREPGKRSSEMMLVLTHFSSTTAMEVWINVLILNSSMSNKEESPVVRSLSEHGVCLFILHYGTILICHQQMRKGDLGSIVEMIATELKVRSSHGECCTSECILLSKAVSTAFTLPNQLNKGCTYCGSMLVAFHFSRPINNTIDV